MGFFDSFKKKENSNPFSMEKKSPPPLSELSPPPLPPAPSQETKSENPVMDAPKMQPELSPVVETLPKKPDNMESKSFPSSPIQEQKTESLFQSLPQEVAEAEEKGPDLFYTPEKEKIDIPKIPQKDDFQSGVPEELPQMPPLGEPFSTNQSNEIPEDIPYFPEAATEYSTSDYNPVLEGLPVLDTENIEMYKNFRPAIKKPLFIRTDHYTQVLTNIDNIKGYVDESSETIYNLENLKRNADAEHKYYKKILEDIQRKLIYIDKIVFSG